MRSRSSLSLVVALLASMAACTDPPFPDDPNAPGKADDPTSPTKPTNPSNPGTPSDGGAAPSADCQITKASGLSCSDVSACSSQCGISMDCMEACKKKGCASAAAAFTAVTDCVMASCLFKCMGGFTPDCEACSKQACAAQVKACDANSCGTTVMCPPPPAPKADGGSKPQPTPGVDSGTTKPPPESGDTCYQVITCSEGCMYQGCVDDCRDKACKTSKVVFDKLEACKFSKCNVDCLTGYNSWCRTCLLGKCAADYNACQSTGC